MDGIPPQLHERITCSIQAAKNYNFDPIILLAVASVENGKAGQWVKNKNGTHDVGPMQLNTAYLATLAKYGVTPKDAAQGGCYSYYLAAWRIKGHILKDRKGDLWTKVSNYHSYTPKYNERYRQKLIASAQQWKIKLENINLKVAPTTLTKIDNNTDTLNNIHISNQPGTGMANKTSMNYNSLKSNGNVNTGNQTYIRKINTSAQPKQNSTSVVWRSQNPIIY